jgi:GMP synthase-like glutamine amidotransferase
MRRNTKNIHVHILQHVPFEGPGSIIPWLVNNNVTCSYCRLYEGNSLPNPADADLLIVMGGPMSVNDDASYPWLKAEKECIKNAIQQKVPVLGICLGAQLIASALGAKVYPNPQKEIGWFPIFADTVAGREFQFPPETTVFHWHGETFELPEGAVRLASNKVCSNQAFQVGTHTIGLQFHLETTPTALDLMITHCKNELVTGEYIQTEQTLREVPEQTYTAVNTLMGAVLDYLVTSR